MFATAGCCLAMLCSLCVGGAAASDALTCRSGRTVFHQGGIRAFVIVRRFEARNPISAFKTFYFCAHGSRHPRVFNEGAPFTSETVNGFRVVGDRLVFFASSAGVSGGSGTNIGWVALRSGVAREGTIFEQGIGNEEEEEEIASGELVQVPLGHFNYAIALNGAMALVGEGEKHEWEVWLMLVKKHSLGRPKLLFKSKTPAEAIDPSTLAINDSTVTWKTAAGVAVSLPRTP